MRILTLLLTVAAVAFWNVPRKQTANQANQQDAVEPKWEYRVLTLDSRQCAADEAVSASLNSYGSQGWELASVSQQAAPFPSQAKGEILLRPAATGAGKDARPQLADSFKGTIDFKLADPGTCRLIFVRQVPIAKP